MSALISTIVLAFLVGNSPIPHLQIVERFTEIENCQKVIEVITLQEESEPPEERIASRLKCIRISTRTDHDDDGPKKPVSTPTANSHPCLDKVSRKYVPCLSTSYNTQ